MHALTDALTKARAQTLRLCADLTDEQMTAEPECQMALNHPAWVLGHLFMLDAFAADMLGMHLTSPVDEAWAERYGPASAPDAHQGGPGRGELIEQMAMVRERLVGRLESMCGGEDSLDVPTPDETFREDFPTLAHLVQYLLWHEAYHAGQLSAWRRAMGLAPVGVAFLGGGA